MTPILVADGLFSRDAIAQSFRERSTDIDPAVAGFVGHKLDQY